MGIIALAHLTTRRPPWGCISLASLAAISRIDRGAELLILLCKLEELLSKYYGHMIPILSEHKLKEGDRDDAQEIYYIIFNRKSLSNK